ncbi:MAG: hypothetical protein EKK32_04460 [Bradyrhizobiaceae bacterium]|nr:MAG: hypothetical protein EKK32_04460 [Bradyrhizobiaceae bacterium]
MLASPRLRGEAGLHRRCNPGEGDSPHAPNSRRVPLTPSPRKRGEGAHRSWCERSIPMFGHAGLQSVDLSRLHLPCPITR